MEVILLKKRVFPGTDTLAERKRFSVFHACTLVIAPMIAALLILILNWINLAKRVTPVPVAISLNPFTDLINLLLWSLLIWNFIGSLRFFEDAFAAGGRFGGFISRGVALVFLIIFPFYYFYNLWCVIRKKE